MIGGIALADRATVEGFDRLVGHAGDAVIADAEGFARLGDLGLHGLGHSGNIYGDLIDDPGVLVMQLGVEDRAQVLQSQPRLERPSC